MKKAVALVLVAASAGLIGCGTDGEYMDCSQLPYGKIRQDCIDKSAPKADRWDSQNDPQLFGVNLEYTLDALPIEGNSQNPAWPDTYWPTYEDSVNARWQGQGVFSPLEKYDQAFNNWTPPAGFENLIPFRACGVEFDQEYYEKLGPAAKYWSNNHGNKAQRDAWNAQDCDEKIETWWGLCHAWVPASILEPEPKKAVTYNGVTFEVSDMKALMIMAYNSSITRFVGRRCNLRTDKIERDEYGRIKQTECRDSNPGTMHVLLSNLLGRDRRAFAEDRTTNYEVWNQPVIGFKVTSLQEISEADATRLIDPGCQDPCDYIWNQDAQRFFNTVAEVKYVTESSAGTEPLIPQISRYTRTDTYNYILELDGDGKIIGGEWLSVSGSSYPSRFNSQMQHPDFFWLPLRAGSRSNPYADLEKIRMLVRMSMEDQPPAGGNTRVYKAAGGVSIPDNDPAGASAVLEVTDDVTIGTLRVTVGITHTYIGDLTLTLRHDGQEQILQKNAGGSTQNLSKTFEVTGFTGSARGGWELSVVDNAARDVGTIDTFELAVIGGSAPAADTYSNSTPVNIPDNDATGVTSVIQVPGSGAVKSVKVQLNITHTWISDLTVELRHGTGVSMLHNREGNDTDDIVKTFTVDEFNGAESGGEWTLQVVDHAGQDVGSLNSWQLVIER